MFNTWLTKSASVIRHLAPMICQTRAPPEKTILTPLFSFLIALQFFFKGAYLLQLHFDIER